MAAGDVRPGAKPLVLLLGPPGAGKSALFKELFPLLAHRVELADSDGRESEALFAHPELLESAPGGFARRVRDADAVAVLLDATAPPEEWADTFAGLRECLDRLRDGRTASRTVGGFPVILTLTKCDLLARPNDAAANWLTRIGVRQVEVETAFTHYFEPEPLTAHDVDSVMVDGDVPDAEVTPPEPGAAFGSLHIDIAAVALNVPIGTGFRANVDRTGGFGVADFADKIAELAAWHAAQTTKSRRLLRRTVVGTLGLFTLLAIGTGWLAASGFGATGILESRVRAYREAEPPPEIRLSDARLARTGQSLRALADDPGFGKLDAGLQQFVENRLAEVASYTAWRGEFDPPRLGPAEVRSRSEALELQHDLGAQLAPPADYAGQWRGTAAGKLRAKWQADLPLFLTAEARWHDSARDALRRVNALLLGESPPDPSWRRSAEAALSAGEPEPRLQVVPGSPALPGPRGRPLTYESVAHVTRVDAALRDLADAQSRLKGLLDVTDAVGLTAPPGSGLAVLDLPEPGARPSPPLAGQVLAELAARYPAPGGANGTARGQFPAWCARPYPDAARLAVESRLRAIRDTAERHLRGLIRGRLGADAPAAWAKLRAELALSQDFQQWDRLTALIDDLLTPPAAGAPSSPGEVTELTAFLARESFPAELPELRITLPDDLFDRRPAPAGPLVLSVTPAGGAARDYSFTTDGEPERSRGAARFTFRPAGHDGKLILRPGDGIAATLPVRAGVQAYKLVWAGGRSPSYPFDALTEPPKVVSGNGNLITPRAAGVRLSVPAFGSWPNLPRLIPEPRSP